MLDTYQSQGFTIWKAAIVQPRKGRLYAVQAPNEEKTLGAFLATSSPYLVNRNGSVFLRYASPRRLLRTRNTIQYPAFDAQRDSLGRDCSPVFG